jgi:hypothetical protein
MGANIGKKVDPKPKQQAEKKMQDGHVDVNPMTITKLVTSQHNAIHLNIRPAIRRLQNQEQFPNTFRGFKILRNSQEIQS